MTLLRKMRQDRKLRLQQVAEAVGVTFQTVHNHEKFGIKTIRVAQRYASFYGCRWLDLLEEPPQHDLQPQQRRPNR